jgi:hypothetical protein
MNTQNESKKNAVIARGSLVWNAGALLLASRLLSVTRTVGSCQKAIEVLERLNRIEFESITYVLCDCGSLWRPFLARILFQQNPWQPLETVGKVRPA